MPRCLHRAAFVNRRTARTLLDSSFHSRFTQTRTGLRSCLARYPHRNPTATKAPRVRTVVSASGGNGRAPIEFYGPGAPWEPRVEARVADVAPRFAFEPALFFESLLAIGFGQYPRADGDREHDDDGGAAVALEFRHIHAPRHAHTLNPT